MKGVRQRTLSPFVKRTRYLLHPSTAGKSHLSPKSANYHPIARVSRTQYRPPTSNHHSPLSPLPLDTVPLRWNVTSCSLRLHGFERIWHVSEKRTSITRIKDCNKPSGYHRRVTKTATISFRASLARRSVFHLPISPSCDGARGETTHFGHRITLGCAGVDGMHALPILLNVLRSLYPRTRAEGVTTPDNSQLVSEVDETGAEKRGHRLQPTAISASM